MTLFTLGFLLGVLLMRACAWWGRHRRQDGLTRLDAMKSLDKLRRLSR